MSAVAQDEWLSVTDAARLVGYHPEHVRELIRESKIEARRFGARMWQVNRRSLLDYSRARPPWYRERDKRRKRPRNVR